MGNGQGICDHVTGLTPPIAKKQAMQPSKCYQSRIGSDTLGNNEFHFAGNHAMRFRSALLLGFFGVVTSLHAAPRTGYHASVAVEKPTRLDWVFAVSNQSPAQAPADWLPSDYDSAKQTYELYVPARRDAKKLLPAILFISAGPEPGGWKAFQTTCQSKGILFAGPRGAGNECAGKQRVRIILDVLDDLRRNYPVDPDRTYLAGFSGGGRIACVLGFALPELFGGIMPICAGGELRDEPWLRHRLMDRLSIAFITGTADFNRGEVERLRGPFFQDIGVRTKVWTQPGLGHGLPNDKTIQEAVRWLDDGAPRRDALAKKYPASRQANSDNGNRESNARTLLAEGKKRTEAKESLYSGLMLLQGVMQRWPDLSAGEEAKKILLEYENKTDKPWEKDDLAEQRRTLIAQAKALDAYASGDLAAQYVKLRPEMAKQAMRLWQQVLADGPTTPAGKEAAKRIPALEKLAGGEEK